MSERSTHWERVYTTKGETEVSWFQESPAISLQMISAANPGRDAAIIDVGGGASRLVDVLLQQGYRSIAVLDLSAHALDAAKTRIGPAAADVDWIVADVTTWRPARSYDVWHDRAAFHFLTERSDRVAYVDRLRSAVCGGGHVIIGTFALDGPEKCSGLPVQRYDGNSLAAELGPDFELLETRRDVHRTPWDSTQAFQFSRFRRRE
ncbi:class I SAM-dependent methyltransferase [Bradyrhizobium sp. CB82]|uniref:class I SAM-dependent methyltransferase n=1 Tax=Bradyrhizobium sp. CB82 TaxID=3039159 RepID=UPI0024B18CB5|nr:class I SAM-dependent methyltransferase [Bradyrhizobium sp. CB82]WFU40732.1 class I SAM-dependent methyltransferase [Bradyrhizobium sp. CB82]